MTVTDFNIAVVDSDSHLSQWIIEQRRLDISDKYCRLFEKYIPIGGTVVDAGACLGDHTASYSEMVGPTGRVFAIESNPAAYRCLLHNMKPYLNVVKFMVALGDRTGFARMTESPAEPNNLGAERVIYGEGSIPVRTLDDLLCVSCMDRLDFIKIDVEGREPWVIEGALSLLGAFHPTLLIEVNKPVLAAFGKTECDIYRPLQALGYEIEPSEPHHTLSMPQLDVLCTRK